jgi:hypothetical protein
VACAFSLFHRSPSLTIFWPWSSNHYCSLAPGRAASQRSSQVLTIPVNVDGVLFILSDGLSDDLWDEDVLDEVVHFWQTFLAFHYYQFAASTANSSWNALRSTLLSRTYCVPAPLQSTTGWRICDNTLEIPFARRARESGRTFSGRKSDGVVHPACPVSHN